MVTIREAICSDAQQCSFVLRNSIRELCTVDHECDEEVIERWTSNKTEESLRNSIIDQSTKFFVAVCGREIQGVGAVNFPNEVALNYVSPNFRYKGVSRAMLKVLEDELRETGCTKGQLTSTITAHDFYLASSWSDVRMVKSWLGLSAYIMEKSL